MDAEAVLTIKFIPVEDRNVVIDDIGVERDESPRMDRMHRFAGCPSDRPIEVALSHWTGDVRTLIVRIVSRSHKDSLFVKVRKKTPAERESGSRLLHRGSRRVVKN